MAQIQFKGKSFVQNHHLLVKYHELIPNQSKSLTDKVSLHDNLIIHGDNLIALKALLPLYAGKIKCIYIDPPYNTGNEKWAYNDNVNSPMMQEWLGKVVDREDLTRHDKWLCMMMPRLKLLRELLKDDGVIFISIDDNEVHNLRILMNEIFGEDNFVGHIIIQSNPRGSQSIKHLAIVHEYVLIYTRDFNRFEMRGLELKESMRAEYKYNYKDDRKYRLLGLRQRGGAWRKEDRPLLYFPIFINPNNGQISLSETDNYKVKVLPIKPTTGEDGTWRWNREKIENNKNLLIGKQIDRKEKDKAWDIYQMDFLKISEEEERRTKAKTIWIDKEVNYQNARMEVKEIFEGRDVFEFPKPKFLIQQLLKMVDFEIGDVILDSFSGSGTTGHAVLDLNQNNNLNCNFILVECEDYANKLTAERVRRVIKGVPNAKDENLKQGLGGTFSYFELGKAIELESILSGDGLPTYEELARYIFYTATGEEFDPKAMNEKKHFVGESRNYKVYLFYEPDIEKLKNIALTLDRAKSIGKPVEKRRLVFAPTKYLDQAHLDELRIDFAQLPFEIYELAR